MPQKYASTQEPFELLYLNGQPQVSSQLQIPVFRDVCLAKASQDDCDSIVDKSKHFTRPIRNEREYDDCIAFHKVVDEAIAKLKELTKQDRTPFVTILQQITTAVEPMQNQLQLISQQLREAVTQWRAMVVEGQRREQERLEREAAQKEAEAKYSESPATKRKAENKAKQLREMAKEAKQAAEEPGKGVSTERFVEGKIESRKQAAGMPDDIVEMNVNQTNLNIHVNQLERAGQKITAKMFPGLRLEFKTRVRFHK